MELTAEQKSLLDGYAGVATQKAMQILVALGKIYGASHLIPVSSVQVAGVSYDNLGEAGLEFLNWMAANGGKAKVYSTLNPAGMDVENWEMLGIPIDFAQKQQSVLQAFRNMGLDLTCTCTPYLAGNLPAFGDHIAWSESSAVCYANSVIGARTNREGGPSALASALTGVTPAYGLHLDQFRKPSFHIHVAAQIIETYQFGLLGVVIGQIMEKMKSRPIPYITGISTPSLEGLKSFCASLATYGGASMFHMAGITPEASSYTPHGNKIDIKQQDMNNLYRQMNTPPLQETDFLSLGCPHLSLQEMKKVAELLKGKTVTREFWITTSRPVRKQAEQAGYTQIIEKAGAKIATDTCCVVAPIKNRFHTLITDSAKACYYASTKNNFETRLLAFEQVIQEATRP